MGNLATNPAVYTLLTLGLLIDRKYVGVCVSKNQCTQGQKFIFYPDSIFMKDLKPARFPWLS